MIKRVTTLFFILTFYLSTFSQQVNFLPNDWQNPAVFEKGQNAPHAFHIPYASANDAIQNMPRKCRNYQLLNGQWKFKWVETPKQVPVEFWQPDFDVSEWDEIKGSFELGKWKAMGIPNSGMWPFRLRTIRPIFPIIITRPDATKGDLLFLKAGKEKEVMFTFRRHKIGIVYLGKRAAGWL